MVDYKILFALAVVSVILTILYIVLSIKLRKPKPVIMEVPPMYVPKKVTIKDFSYIPEGIISVNLFKDFKKAPFDFIVVKSNGSVATSKMLSNSPVSYVLFKLGKENNFGKLELNLTNKTPRSAHIVRMPNASNEVEIFTKTNEVLTPVMKIPLNKNISGHAPDVLLVF